MYRIEKMKTMLLNTIIALDNNALATDDDLETTWQVFKDAWDNTCEEINDFIGSVELGNPNEEEEEGEPPKFI